MRWAVWFIVAGLAGCSGKREAAGSWRTADYVAAGVPDPNRPWTAAERTRAVEVIVRVSDHHPERLPRPMSDADAVFDRLLDHGEPDPIGTPVATRVAQHLRRWNELQFLSATYSGNGGSITREGVQIFAAIYEDALQESDLIDQDPGFADAVANVLLDGIDTVADSRGDASVRHTLADALARSLVPLAAHLSPDRRRAVAAELRALVDGADLGELRSDVVALSKQLPPP